jgi:hypothetical protein
MNVTIRIYPVGSGLLMQSELDQIAAWHDAAFSDLPVAKQYEWTLGGDFNVLLNVEGDFAGFVGLMKREVLFDGQLKIIGGVRGLVIDPKFRRMGLGKIIMAEAAKVIFQTLKADYGFLLCLDEHLPFYGSVGWQELRCPVFVENEKQKVQWTESAMILGNGKVSPGNSFSQIDLMGLAF